MTPQKVPEHEHPLPRHEHEMYEIHDKLFIMFITVVISVLISEGMLAIALSDRDERISALEKNATEMQNWIMENSEIVREDVFLNQTNLFKFNPETNCYKFSEGKTYCFNSYTIVWGAYHVFKDTNISTERFFR